MGHLLVFPIIFTICELGTTALGDTLELWVAVLRPQVVQQIVLRHKLSVTVCLCTREGLIPPVHVGQVSLEMMLASKLLAALWALMWFGSLVHFRHVLIKVELQAELLPALLAVVRFHFKMNSC